MRIHTDRLTHQDVIEAARRAGRYTVNVRFTEHGSQRRDHAFNVSLTGTSSRRPNNAAGGRFANGLSDAHAATWDEWGMFLAELFRRDPAAVVPKIYESGEHFRWTTGARFDTLTPAEQHGAAGHKWSGRYPNITGVYTVAECLGRKGKPCAATIREMRGGHAFAEISGQSFAELEGV